MSDPMSDLTFRPEPPARRRLDGQAWEAVVREELLKLRRRSPATTRVVAVRRASAPGAPDPGRPAE
jgi:hypothetical protein